jgi:ribosomal protein S18 acetylase RimI-like enzyme
MVDVGLRKEREGLANHAQGPESPLPAGELGLQGDSGVLYRAIWECIRTSPDAFLMTQDEFKEKSADYWRHEVQTATWAVVETGTEVIGVAASRRPDPEADSDVDPDRARFIESAWIEPEHRRGRMGKRLMEFLFEEERQRHPQVDEFLLWVFNDNETAISFYAGIGFEYTDVSKKHDPSGRTELRYRYAWNSSSTWASGRTAAKETYRILDTE